MIKAVDLYYQIKRMDNLLEYLVEINVKDANLDNVLTALTKIGLQLDETFRPKLLKVKTNKNSDKNFLIKGRIKQKALNTLSLNNNVSNYWSNTGNIPF